jgi:hypothetical protein
MTRELQRVLEARSSNSGSDSASITTFQALAAQFPSDIKDSLDHAAIAWALGTRPEIYRHVEVANCSITTVGMVAGLRRLVRTNENAHLEGLALEP